MEIELESQVAEQEKKVKEIIRDSYSDARKNNFYSKIVKELSDSTRNTKLQIDYIDAYEKAMGVFRQTAIELRKENAMDVLTLEEKLAALNSNPEKKLDLELEKEIKEAIMFSNKYALYFAGQVGLALLNSEESTTEKRVLFEDLLCSTDRDAITTNFSKLAISDLDRVIGEKRRKGEQVSDEDLKYTLECVFTTWINQFNYKRFEETVKKFGLEELTLRYGNFSIKAGEFKRKYNIVVLDDKFMNVKKEDVIGGQEYSSILWNNIIKLLSYDSERKENPFDPASVIFTYGAPGGGKTFNSHACIQSAADFCKEKGIPLWAFTHSVTDYASHYQNLTANQLSSLANQIQNHQGPVIMYVADADIVFMSRNDPQITQEQRQTMSVYMKMFDGTMIPKNGKFMAIMDANYIENVDDATKSRIFDVILELKRFDKPEQFAEYAKRYLTRKSDGIGIKDEEWQELGKYLLDSQLSNREVMQVLKQSRGGLIVPEDYVTKGWDEKVKFRNDYLKGITKDEVIAKFENYRTTRLEMEESSRKSRMVEDYERFKADLLKVHKPTAES